MTENDQPPESHPVKEPANSTGATLWSWIVKAVVVLLGTAVGLVLAMIIGSMTGLIELRC